MHVVGGAWIQVDLRGIFTLKYIRIPVRSTIPNHTANFEDIEIRFGNRSRSDGFPLNPVIAYTGIGQENKIFELCLDRPLVGQYLQLYNNKKQQNFLTIGEIQITVD